MATLDEALKEEIKKAEEKVNAAAAELNALKEKQTHFVAWLHLEVDAAKDSIKAFFARIGA